MTSRPYFKYSVQQLREVFETHKDDIQVLGVLDEELSHRNRPKACKLRTEVKERLAGGGHGDPRPSTSTKQEGPGAGGASLRGGRSSLSTQQGPGEGIRTPSSTSGHMSARVDLPPDDRRVPPKFVRIQHPGVEGRPSKWVPERSRDLTLDVPAGASRALRFSVALDALISEMKEKGTGSRSIILNDGISTDLGTDGFGYVFDFVDDAEIFEDARVQVVVDRRQCSGSIVSILPGRIVLTLDANCGPRIRTCVLKIDTTALLIALKDRLDEVDKKTLSVNTALADRVISRGSDEGHAPSFVDSDDTSMLNANQRRAVELALQREVSFVWGPPGTGKTFTLADLVRRLFQKDQRVLVASNTNQAVDQLLVKLCEHLGTEHPALVGGKVLRMGQASARRLGTFAEYLIVDQIVERLSKELHERRARLQAALGEVEADLTKVETFLGLYAERESVAKQLEELEASSRRLEREHQKLKGKLAKQIEKVARAMKALEAWQSAGALRRTLMPSRSELDRRVESESSSQRQVEGALRRSSMDLRQARTERETHKVHLGEIGKDLVGKDPRTLTREQGELEARRAPIRSELAGVQAQLDDMAKKLISEARVIGTTVTRTYLSVKELGQFDVVILDEASMVLLPALYLVSGLAKQSVVVSGDFNQLPPIVQTNQEAIFQEVGRDVFWEAGVTDSCRRRRPDARVVMLDTQYRMTEPICDLMTEAMDYKGLRSGTLSRTSTVRPLPPDPYSGPLTVIDSSRLWPFESRNLLGSRFNLMHSLLVRNFCWHMKERGFVKGKEDLGVCTPYSAQGKLTSELLKDEGLGDLVHASTVHRYQGAERRMMLLDIPEGIGSGFNIGVFMQADQDNDDGAKLQNVAVSRTQEHLVVLANLTYLDKKLPSNAKLRLYLYEMQKRGRVVDAQDLLALRPISGDLQRLTGAQDIEWDAGGVGLFRQEGFDRFFQHDVRNAKKSVAVFSGFVTPQRIAAYGDLFRSKVEQGVAVRCVTRPPDNNGSIDPEATRQALDALEGIGVVVDTRWVIHEKVVIIDEETVWFGSLNPLSHTARTDELMQRVVSRGWAAKLAALLAIAPTGGSDVVGVSVRKENPTCQCGGRMCFSRGKKWGPFFKCEICGKTRSLYRR